MTFGVIINPEANHGQARSLAPRLKTAFPDVRRDRFLVTKAAGEATAAAADWRDCDKIIIVGGDGTVSETINGLAQANRLGDVTLGLVPAGSGNDLAKALGLTPDLEKSLAALERGVIRIIDLGVVSGKVYANSLAIGFDARVAHLANKIKTEVMQTGLRLYLTALFRIVRRDYYCHKVRMRIGQGDWQDKEILLAAVNNGKVYGGGFKITPKAEVDDGLLEICVIDALPRWQLFLRLPFAIAGLHGWMKPAHFYRAASFTLESDTAVPAALDGELIAEISYKAEILPGALKIISGK